MEQSQMATNVPETKQGIPEGTASLVNWIKVRCVYPEKVDYSPSTVNTSGTHR